MSTEVGHASDEQTPTHLRDVPPHLPGGTIVEEFDLEFNSDLEDVQGPLDSIPEDSLILNYETEELPGLFVPRHVIEFEAKSRIEKALKLGYKYLHRPGISQGSELTRSDFKRPLLIEALGEMEETVRKFRVVILDEKISGAAPRLDSLAQTT
jgi:hypothetical protein